jgi:AcrR family transcriptional regulator
MEKSPSGRPSKEERDAIRRSQIVQAAKACVCRHGFHGATMAEIATEAKMSAGQIYRYFVNKEAIVAAIVQVIVQERLAMFSSYAKDPDLPSRLSTELLGPETADQIADRTLLMEVTAEAARNPAIASIAQDAQRQIHRVAQANFKADHPHLSEADISARIELISAIAEGSNARRVLGRATDDPALHALYRQIIDLLVQPKKP